MIVGESCFNRIYKLEIVNVNKIYIFGNGRLFMFELCENVFEIKEIFRDNEVYNNCDIFVKMKNDDKIVLFIEDIEFFSFMDKELEKDCEGSWIVFFFFKK